MKLTSGFSLKTYNSFGIDVTAKYFAVVKYLEELYSLIDTSVFHSENKFILGGGSNILFTKNFDGLIIKSDFKGINIMGQDNDHVYIKAGGGENWHHFVMFCVQNSWGGIENLSLIPGTVGASPIQNIGAYGSELKDTFHELEAFDLDNNKILKFSNETSKFGYRDSIFKREYKGKLIILSVTFKLRKKPILNTLYGDINKELEALKVYQPTIKEISQAVCNIRRRKLPDPTEIGNAGSFFKNPLIDDLHFEKLKENYPNIVGYKAGENKIKAAAAWLIEQCGWKGKRIGDAGVHKNQALVLVNYGNAKGSEILELSKKIQESVMEKFAIKLEPEINIL
jgi:UDP-N-acetylmuramate dehydrogenase